MMIPKDFSTHPSRLIVMALAISGSLLVLGAGCKQVAEVEQSTTNTNVETVNTETVGDSNDEAAIANINTSDDIGSGYNGIDISGWLTYENEEYGFKLKYPNNYIVDDSHEGANFRSTTSDPAVANQENIKFYIQNYNKAPDKQGEAYALLYTKTELSSLKDEMIQTADKMINTIPVNLYYNYDVSGAVFYRGANFFVNQNFITASMVIMPEGIEYPNHPFDSETREWSNSIIQQLDEGELISQNDDARIKIFNTMINTLQLL